ncbi:18S rRNA maturation protein [Coemansia sp. RSA 988]|nr:18S rRNA maturation protein [Coemansia sp. RSA 988]
MPKTDQRSQNTHSNKPYKRSGNSSVQSGNKSNQGQKASQPPVSLGACKKQIRDVTRLLSREGLPSTARVELERRLKALTIQQKQLTNSEKDRANASRYHKIKFFERKKVSRMLTQIDKQLEIKEITPEAREKLTTDKQEHLVNLNYTTYYPNEFKYISLFPANPSSTTEETAKRRETIRLAVSEAMERGDLPKDPRDISVRERKAIRRGCRFMLRSVSTVHGKNMESASLSDIADDDDARLSDTAGVNEEDEFFA